MLIEKVNISFCFDVIYFIILKYYQIVSYIKNVIKISNMYIKENKCQFSLNYAVDQVADDLVFILKRLNTAYKE